MLKKRLLIIFIFAAFCSSFIGWWFFHASKNQECAIWPVTISPFNGHPYVDVEIEGHVHPFLFDLGSKFDLSIRASLLDLLEQKTEAGEATWTGMKGNFYRTKKYKIPKITIGSKIFTKLFVTQGDDNYLLTDAIFYDGLSRDPKEKLKEKIGSVGRPILEKTNVLLDFPQKRIYAVNSLKKLKALGYAIETWQKVPFHIDRGIVIEAATDFGVHSMILDTGATYVTVDKSLVPDEVLIEPRPGLIVCYSSKLVIGGVDYGKIGVYPHPWPEVGKGIQGLIGMNFLKKHVCYVDYKNKCLYLDTNTEIAD